MNEKNEIRKEMLSRRKSMDKSTADELSKKICAVVQALDLYKSAEDLCLYMPVNNETDVMYLAKAAFCDGKNIWMPKVNGREMDFFLWDENTEMEKGAFGIPEPKSQIKLEPNENTLVIMPGAAFSLKYERIGYGGGYYDRFLEKHPECKTAAVCFGFQILPELPSEEHDIKPNAIICEDKVLL